MTPELLVEAGVFAGAALAAYEVRVLADGPPERVNRHWAFALPSRHLCVHLADVAEAPAGPGLIRAGGTCA